MLLGQVIKIWTDNENLTYDNTDFSSDRILHQRLIIEEFGATINFISGVNNEAANTLSRLDTRANKLTNFQECFLMIIPYQNFSALFVYFYINFKR